METTRICPACDGHGAFVGDPALARLLRLVRQEVERAEAKHKPMNSPHEGYAVILEELDELWAHVRADTGRGAAARAEAIQVAAMGLRYALNVCERLAGPPAVLAGETVVMRR